jgi:hypothetical protein
MSEFRISEAQYRKFRRMFLLISIPISVLIVAGMVFLEPIRTTGISIPVLYFNLAYLLFLVALFAFLIYWILRRLHLTMMSYTLTISESGVTFDQWYAKPLSISLTDIKEIIKKRSGGFLVRGKTEIIGVPRWVDDKSKVEEQLRALAPITTNPKFVRRSGLQALGLIVALVLFICLEVSTNKIAQAISNLSIVGFLGWLLYRSRTIKDPTRDDRVMSRIILFFMVVMIIGAVVRLLLF